MAKKDFTATIELEKSSRDVFKAITDDVAKWWGGKDLKGSSTKLNNEFVIHHWLEKDKHEWTNTKIIFEIAVQGDKTLLRFTHDGLVPEKECYERCAHEGWSIVIKGRLFNFITTGKAI